MKITIYKWEDKDGVKLESYLIHSLQYRVIGIERERHDDPTVPRDFPTCTDVLFDLMVGYAAGKNGEDLIIEKVEGNPDEDHN